MHKYTPSLSMVSFALSTYDYYEIFLIWYFVDVGILEQKDSPNDNMNMYMVIRVSIFLISMVCRFGIIFNELRRGPIMSYIIWIPKCIYDRLPFTITISCVYAAKRVLFFYFNFSLTFALILNTLFPNSYSFNSLLFFIALLFMKFIALR